MRRFAIGTNDDDILKGGAQDGLLIGGSGTDNLDGESGNDTGLGGGGTLPRTDAAATVLGDMIATEQLLNEAFSNIFAFE